MQEECGKALALGRRRRPAGGGASSQRRGGGSTMVQPTVHGRSAGDQGRVRFADPPPVPRLWGARPPACGITHMSRPGLSQCSAVHEETPPRVKPLSASALAGGHSCAYRAALAGARAQKRANVISWRDTAVEIGGAHGCNLTSQSPRARRCVRGVVPPLPPLEHSASLIMFVSHSRILVKGGVCSSPPRTCTSQWGLAFERLYVILEASQ